MNKVQYIRVMRTAVDGSDNALTMAELEAKDSTGTNLALNKPTTSSSTYYGEFPANLGNDGDNTNFMHTIGGEELGWWEVDLEGELDIRKIVVHNRIGSDPKRITGVLVALDSGRNELFNFNVQGVAGSQTFNLPVPDTGGGGNGETGDNGETALQKFINDLKCRPGEFWLLLAGSGLATYMIKDNFKGPMGSTLVAVTIPLIQNHAFKTYPSKCEES
jgi:hypothetical protein